MFSLPAMLDRFLSRLLRVAGNNHIVSIWGKQIQIVQPKRKILRSTYHPISCHSFLNLPLRISCKIILKRSEYYKIKEKKKTKGKKKMGGFRKAKKKNPENTEQRIVWAHFLFGLDAGICLC